MATHRFTPSRYHLSIGSHEPALRIADGDTVITSTIDAHGYDETETQVIEAGNPMTGPFYVEGAEPGDTLVVTLDKIVPNREYGWARTIVAPNVLEPEYVYHLPPEDDWKVARWRIDAAAGTATLAEPADTMLGALVLPIEPMVGCFGVAPSRGQAISTATSGEFGGNMDYRGFTEGVTACFPVFVAGALFHLGDVHAVQSDGEIGGTGIEISSEVQFSVQLKKDAMVQWPGGEDERYVFTVGNARPLDQAVQHATTEMLRRLQREYRLDAISARILMGQCVEYDVGNIFDPAYTMVCKIPKHLLPYVA